MSLELIGYFQGLEIKEAPQILTFAALLNYGSVSGI